MIRFRRAVLFLFAVYILASVISATQLEFAQEAPSLVRKDSVPGRVQVNPSAALEGRLL